MSQAIKDLLAAAAGPTGAGDQGWHAGRVSRLYFSDAKDVNAAGQVDVIEGDTAPAYVRVEAWVRPELAAQIIALVTGEGDSVEVRLRRQLREELTIEITNKLESEAVANKAPPTDAHVPAQDDPHGFRARDTASQADLARRDAERSTELDALIAAQADDDAETEVTENDAA